MKTIIALLLTTLSVLSADIRVTWDANPPADNVTNYIVSWGGALGSYTRHENAGTNITHILTNVPTTGSSYVIVRAQNTAGISVPSDPATIPGRGTPPSKPTGVRVQVVVFGGTTTNDMSEIGRTVLTLPAGSHTRFTATTPILEIIPP